MPQETRPLDDLEFHGEAQRIALGRFSMTSVGTSPAQVIHSKQQVAKASCRRFNLCLLVKGQLVVSHENEDISLEEGDLILADSEKPYRLWYNQPCLTLGLVIMDADLKHYLPRPEEAVGIRFAGSQGLAHTLATTLQSLWRQSQADLEPEIGARVAGSVLDLFAATWLQRQGMQPSDSSTVGYRRAEIKRHIESQLRDPALSARSISEAFGISSRYLHMLFEREGETVSNYILRRRLDYCFKQLSDPLWSKRTITEIAFSWGFNNATHFARVFKLRHDMTPREFRQQSLRSAP